MIYLTDSSEHITVKRASEHKLAAFLHIPFQLEELAINNDTALTPFATEVSFGVVNHLVKDVLFTPNKFVYYRITKREYCG